MILFRAGQARPKAPLSPFPRQEKHPTPTPVLRPKQPQRPNTGVTEAFAPAFLLRSPRCRPCPLWKIPPFPQKARDDISSAPDSGRKGPCRPSLLVDRCDGGVRCTVYGLRCTVHGIRYTAVRTRRLRRSGGELLIRRQSFSLRELRRAAAIL